MTDGSYRRRWPNRWGGSSLRRQGQHIVEATADGGQRSNLLVVDGCGGTSAVAVHAVRNSIGHNGNFAQANGFFVQADIQDLGLTQVGDDTFLLDRLETDHAVLNRVRTTGTDVEQTVVTVGIGHSIIL